MLRVFECSIVSAVLAALLASCGCNSGSCRRDSHCQVYVDRGVVGADERLYCVDRACSQCREDSHCEDSEICVEHECQVRSGYCDDEHPCPSPLTCRDNLCGPECRRNDDCAEGQFPYCDAGRCAQGQCFTDDDCMKPRPHCQMYMCRLDCTLPPCRRGDFRPVAFDFDESRLTREAWRTMSSWNVWCLRLEPDRPVIIAGHTDERGTAEYNLALGERRARAVHDFIEQMGIDHGQIRVISYGESRPSDPRSTENAWRQNRRVELDWDD